MSQPVDPMLAIVPSVQVSTNMVAGSDGRPWVQIVIQCGPALMGLVVPEHICAELAGILGKDLTIAAAKARRAGLGLIVPGQSNGGRP